MARNCPIWARSLVDPASLEHEQIRCGQHEPWLAQLPMSPGTVIG